MNIHSSRLPAVYRRALGVVRHLQYGIDRLTFAIDHSEPPKGMEKLKKMCGDRVRFSVEAAPYQPHWKGQLDLLQPSADALRHVREMQAIYGYAIQLRYVELACDFITSNARRAQQVTSWLLEHACPLYSRSSVDIYEKTYYFHRRADVRGRKTSRVLAVYADKRSKIASTFKGSRCAHAEWRLWGPATLRGAGIASIDDLLTFDHAAYWEKYVRFVQLPSKSALGAWLSDSDNVSRTTWHHRATEFKNDYTLGDAFVLQNALLDYPELENLLTPIDAGTIFGGWV
jgi:hypothetical protein